MKLVTEEEAKDLVCPLSMNHPEDACNCLGKNCMWFQKGDTEIRWVKESKKEPKEIQLYFCAGSHW